MGGKTKPLDKIFMGNSSPIMQNWKVTKQHFMQNSVNTIMVSSGSLCLLLHLIE